MTDAFSEAEARILDRFAPPPLAPGFADRVVTRLPFDAVPLPRRGDPRGGWRRGRVALLAGIGGALLSVGAAAAGLLGARLQNMPVITTIATVVDAPRVPRDSSSPPPRKSAFAKPKPADASGEGKALVTVLPTQPEGALFLADRIEARMKRRDVQGLSVPSLARIEARRDAMVARDDPRAETLTAALAILKDRAEAGTLPRPRTQRQVNREQWRARIAALPPEERVAIEARRELRRQQRLAAVEPEGANTSSGEPVTEGAAEGRFNGQRPRERWMQMTPEERAEWRAKRAAREAMMTPEQRERLKQRREERRSRMLAPREGLTGGPEPAPLESAAPQ
jgi:hypothetical protein